MSRRLTGLAALAALAMLTLTLVVPLAVADHAYSHRMILYGRLVDADGNPAQGMTVDLRAEHFEYEGGCSQQQPNTETEAWGPTYTKPVTNSYGEFVFCLHMHSMSRFEPGTAVLKVTNAQGAEEISEAKFELNGYQRVIYVNLQLPTSKNVTESPFDTAYTVAGRLWTDSGEQRIEGITVFGDTVKFANVSVEMTYNDGKTATANTTTNGYGDFSIRVPVTERPTSGTVKITANNLTKEEPIDAKYGITTFTVTYREPRDPFLTQILIGLGVVAGAAVVIGGGVYGYRKMADSRAASTARERSTRKRAQR